MKAVRNNGKVATIRRTTREVDAGRGLPKRVEIAFQIHDENGRILANRMTSACFGKQNEAGTRRMAMADAAHYGYIVVEDIDAIQ